MALSLVLWFFKRSKGEISPFPFLWPQDQPGSVVPFTNTELAGFPIHSWSLPAIMLGITPQQDWGCSRSSYWHKAFITVAALLSCDFSEHRKKENDIILFFCATTLVAGNGNRRERVPVFPVALQLPVPQPAGDLPVCVSPRPAKTSRWQIVRWWASHTLGWFCRIRTVSL